MQRMHRLGPRLFIGLLAVVVAAGVASPAYAQAKTKITLAGTSVYAGQSSTLRVELTNANGNPLANEPVTVERKVAGAWVLVDGDTTNAEGRASVTAELSKRSGENVFRARYDGPTGDPSRSGAVKVDLKRRNSTVTVDGPGRVKDEKSVDIRVAWETGSGEAVSPAG